MHQKEFLGNKKSQKQQYSGYILSLLTKDLWHCPGKSGKMLNDFQSAFPSNVTEGRKNCRETVSENRKRGEKARNIHWKTS